MSPRTVLATNSWHLGHPASILEISVLANVLRLEGLCLFDFCLRACRFVGVACCMYLLPLWVQGARDYAASGQVQLPLCAALSAQLCFAYAAVVYCASWPERWMPGVFDMVVSGRGGCALCSYETSI